jgi:carbon monoxide dehydrogenase subunit G
MKFAGDIHLEAPRAAVFAKLRDARFFASCVEGVRDLNEIDPDHYTAVLDTKVRRARSRPRSRERRWESSGGSPLAR